MDALMNRVRLEAERVGRLKAPTRVGTITSYDPASYAVKVMLQPDETETGFIPLSAVMVGNGWGVQFGPTIGDQVVVTFQEDGHEVPIAAGLIFDNVNRPMNVPTGEMWLVHQSGSYFKLTTDGKALLHSTGEIDVGNVTGTLHTLLTDLFMMKYNDHTHISGAEGSPTGVPLAPNTLASTDFTTVLKAN